MFHRRRRNVSLEPNGSAGISAKEIEALGSQKQKINTLCGEQ
jgi:hypothetical protein